jgi:hypothetical protein
LLALITPGILIIGRREKNLTIVRMHLLTGTAGELGHFPSASGGWWKSALFAFTESIGAGKKIKE